MRASLARKIPRLLPRKKVDLLRSSSHLRASTSSPDAVMILAGGLNPDGTLPPWVVRRMEKSLSLHRSSQGASPLPLVCLGGGTPHRPPVLDTRGYVVHEGSACAAYLLDQGVDPRAVFKEAASYDTLGNAFFAATIHALPAQWRDLAVVTSDFHMARTRAHFDVVFYLAEQTLEQSNGFDPYSSIDSKALTWTFPHRKFRLTYHAVSDEGIFSAPEILQARKERERESLRKFLENAKAQRWRSLSDFHHWLHTTHLCYSVARMHEFGTGQLDEIALKTY